MQIPVGWTAPVITRVCGKWVTGQWEEDPKRLSIQIGATAPRSDPSPCLEGVSITFPLVPSIQAADRILQSFAAFLDSVQDAMHGRPVPETMREPVMLSKRLSIDPEPEGSQTGRGGRG